MILQKIKLSVLLTMVGITFPCAVFAQSFLPDALVFSVAPENPRAGEMVTVTVSSFSADLNTSFLSWTVSGKNAGSGTGKTEIAFRLGAEGSSSAVNLSVETKSGATLSKQFVIRPSSIHLLWQANSYVPPLYRGKALPPPGSTITVAVVPPIIGPQGTALRLSDLIYTWKRNGITLGDQSGRGKSTTHIGGPDIAGETFISVEITNGTTFASHGEISIPAVDSQILLYENDPLAGVLFERAVIDTYELRADEVKLTSYPYFMSTSNRVEPVLTYRWRVDGSPAESVTGDSGSIVLRRVSDAEGSASLSVAVENTSKILERALQALTIHFSNKQ